MRFVMILSQNSCIVSICYSFHYSMAASIYSLTRYSNCDSSNSMVTELAIDAYYPHSTSPTYLVLFIMCIETGRFFIEGSFESF